ncbi:hypothetical protein ACTXL6_21460, partial [Brachybacterium tyrofermentans]
MNQKPTPDAPPRTKDVSPRTKKGGLRTVGAFVLSAVLMLSVMNQKPTPDAPPRTKDVSPRTKKDGMKTTTALAASAVLLIVVFLVAAACPAFGFLFLCVGVVIKGATSLMEALMKTEDDDYWRPDVRKSIAQMNVFAVI